MRSAISLGDIEVSPFRLIWIKPPRRRFMIRPPERCHAGAMFRPLRPGVNRSGAAVDKPRARGISFPRTNAWEAKHVTEKELRGLLAGISGRPSRSQNPRLSLSGHEPGGLFLHRLPHHDELALPGGRTDPGLRHGHARTPDLRGQSAQDLRASGAVLRQRFLHAVPLGDGTAARGTGAAAAGEAARIGLNETEGSALFQRPLGSGIERSDGERVRADRPSVSVRVVGDSGSTSIWPEMMPPRAISIRP